MMPACFQRGAAARALRGGEPDPFGEIVVGQAPVLLQRVQQLDVELVHARFSHNSHEWGRNRAKYGGIRTRFASSVRASCVSLQATELRPGEPDGSLSARRAARTDQRAQSRRHRRFRVRRVRPSGARKARNPVRPDGLCRGRAAQDQGHLALSPGQHQLRAQSRSGQPCGALRRRARPVRARDGVARGRRRACAEARARSRREGIHRQRQVARRAGRDRDRRLAALFRRPLWREGLALRGRISLARRGRSALRRASASSISTT